MWAYQVIDVCFLGAMIRVIGKKCMAHMFLKLEDRNPTCTNGRPEIYGQYGLAHDSHCLAQRWCSTQRFSNVNRARYPGTHIFCTELPIV